MSPRSALVVTVVHHPEDARIRHRQIASLLAAGWRVTYAAPFRDHAVTPPVGIPRLFPVDLPRSSGRHRVGAGRAARRLLAEHGPGHDVILLHDPELVPATVGLRLPPVVWDVHEDTAAALQVRAWVPDLLRRPAQWSVHRLERWAEARMALLLAEHEYAARFRRPHPVVPNTTRVPEQVHPAAEPDEDGVLRVVYLGTVTMERGAAEMAALGRTVRERTGGRVRLEVIGAAHGEAEGVVAAAHRGRDLHWHGFLPNDSALPMLEGALAGLSLLHDVPNYRHSMPTKVIEYLARGIPAVSTPLPVPAALVDRSGAGVLVPFRDVETAAEVVIGLADDPERARAMGRAGHALALQEFDWDAVAPQFVAALEAAAAGER